MKISVSMPESRESRVKIGGLLLMGVIWLWAFLTRKDPFWAGKAAFFSAFVILGVAIYEVMGGAVEKS